MLKVQEEISRTLFWAGIIELLVLAIGVELFAAQLLPIWGLVLGSSLGGIFGLGLLLKLVLKLKNLDIDGDELPEMPRFWPVSSIAWVMGMVLTYEGAALLFLGYAFESLSTFLGLFVSALKPSFPLWFETQEALGEFEFNLFWVIAFERAGLVFSALIIVLFYIVIRFRVKKRLEAILQNLIDSLVALAAACIAASSLVPGDFDLPLQYLGDWVLMFFSLFIGLLCMFAAGAYFRIQPDVFKNLVVSEDSSLQEGAEVRLQQEVVVPVCFWAALIAVALCLQVFSSQFLQANWPLGVMFFLLLFFVQSFALRKYWEKMDVVHVLTKC